MSDLDILQKTIKDLSNAYAEKLDRDAFELSKLSLEEFIFQCLTLDKK